MDYIYKFEFDRKTLYARLDKDANILTSQVENFEDEGYENTGKGITEECNDVDELAVAIAKQIIQSSSNIRYSVYDGDECQFEDMEMSNDYEFEMPEDNDEYVNLKLEPIASPCLRYEIKAIEDEDDVDTIRNYIEDENWEELLSYIEEDQEVFDMTFNLFGDEEGDVFRYTIEDNDGDTIDERTIVVSEKNVFKYTDAYDYYVDNEHNKAPEHLLVWVSEIRNPYTCFMLPKGANVNNIHFAKENIYNSNHDPMGDTITSILELHYAGTALQDTDCMDDGTEESTHFLLLEKDSTKPTHYKVIAEME